MDIIDIVVAHSLSAKGSIDRYAALAEKAVRDATTAVSNIDTITEQTNANNELARDTLDDAISAITQLNEATEDLEGLVPTIVQDVEASLTPLVKQLTISTSSTNNSSYKGTNLITTYPDSSTSTISNIVKLYTTTGNQEDGSMTQKAITDAIRSSGGGSGGGDGGSTNLGPENSEKIVVVGPTGTIIAGNIKEGTLITALVQLGLYQAEDAVGLNVDYVNKTFTRTQNSAYLNPGADFDAYPMYGGRMRCNVADDGTITAFYGQTGYKEDGSNGQVMVYQPKFYYQRIPTVTSNLALGKAIRQESIALSSEPQGGFKLHPLFKAADGSELEYVLLPAYEACAYDTSASAYDLNDSANIDFSADKLSSIAGAKPISGVNKQLTVFAAEQLANNRGEGWHITNLAAESVTQLLEIVEFGTLNGQNALEAGITTINNTAANCSSITGSTESLGNASGAATATINEINGTRTSYNTAGKRAITYRGMENPWGNIWRMVGGLNIVGNGSSLFGIPYVCTDFNYSALTPSTYDNLGFCITSSNDYISAFGYGNSNYDWAFLPVECNSANSALPVGDYTWGANNLNGTKLATVGGNWYQGERSGIFSYGFDQNIDSAARSFSARLMFIPTKNSIYEQNINKWTALIGN